MKKPLTAAYAAGLIDGEGCLYVQCQKTKKGRPIKPIYSIRLDIGMAVKALPLLEKLKVQYGGSLRLKRKAIEKQAAIYYWTLSGKTLKVLLDEVAPYLIIKQEQAKHLLRLYQMKQDLKKGKQCRWTDEARRDAAVIKQMISELNRTGPTLTQEGGWYARLVAGQWLTPQLDLLSYVDSLMIKCGIASLIPDKDKGPECDGVDPNENAH